MPVCVLPQLTTKLDVFSLGVAMFEMAGLGKLYEVVCLSGVKVKMGW